MADTSSEPISFATLLRFKHGDSDRWHDFLREINELGLYEPLNAWRAPLRKHLPQAHYNTRLTAWLAQQLSWVPNCRERIDLDDAFLRDELRAFIARTDAVAHEREAILDQYAIPYVPCDPYDGPVFLRGRVYELLFLPGIIFDWCRVTMSWHLHAYKAARAEKNKLRALNRHFQANAFLPPADKIVMRRRTDVLIAFLDLEYPHPDHVKAWQKKLGITRKKLEEPQSQGLWTPVFHELVHILQPFCSGPKTLYLRTQRGSQPDEVFSLASNLMHFSQPDLWPHNRGDLVKQRYYYALKFMP